MKKTGIIVSVIVYLVLINAFSNFTFAAVLVNESFENHAVGMIESNEDAAITVNKGLPQEIMITEDESSDGSKSLFLDANADSTLRLEVVWSFPKIDSDKSVYLSFDVLPSAVRTLEVYLAGERDTSSTIANGPTIRLDQYKRILAVIPPGSTDKISDFDPHTWYRITITLDSISQGKYNISVKPLDDSGTFFSKENCEFRFNLKDIRQLHIRNYSAATGSQYIDNVMLVEDYTNII